MSELILYVVCRGSRQKLTHSGTSQFRYNSLRRKYTNCTYIEGNLEIVFLNNKTIKYDLSFLETIREITGYVLIVAVYADYIPLTNLQIIRGRELFPHKEESYSLFVAANYYEGSRRIGLKELRFKSLGEILNGKVAFLNNNLLCFEMTVNWTDINPSSKPPVEFVFDSNFNKRKCGECHENCYHNTTKQRNCWGSGPDMCQRLSRGAVCSESCDNRCFGKLPNQCCHGECAGGCTGPKKTDCLACRKFSNDGECVPYCPQLQIYNEKKFQWEKNANSKYTYGSLCVKDCPEHMLKDTGACVRKCPPNKRAVNNTCVPCEKACPKTCNGTVDWLTPKNIASFKDCTVIEGNLNLLGVTFRGDPLYNISALDLNQLVYLKSVREITGYFNIQASPSELKNLSFLENLEVIGGRSENAQDKSLVILQTQLESLELTSLKSIRNDNVAIKLNKNLCYANTINFKRMFTNSKQMSFVSGNGEFCHNKTCDAQCKHGCWGEGPARCLYCVNFRVKKLNRCVASCSSLRLYYDAGNKICMKCHEQCANSCSGPEENKCDSCLRVQHGPNCMDDCPPNMYPNEKKICQMCHVHCDSGCTGPSNELKNGGCFSCKIGVQQRDGRIICLSKEMEECPDGFHRSYKKDVTQMIGKIQLCVLCHKDCYTCLGEGNFSCKKCRKYKWHSQCVSTCPKNFYSNDEKQMCLECHNECVHGCYGPSSSECEACRNFKIHTNNNQTKFNCSEACPEDMPYKVKDSVTGDLTVCADDTHPVIAAKNQDREREEGKKMRKIVIGSVCAVLIIIVVIGYFVYYTRKNSKELEKVNKLNATMMRYEDSEPLTPTGIKPDLAQLRLIKEYELRRGGIIGSGAFGTVYKGFWIPDGENVKIPVAIKVLQEGTPSQNKELLEEARVMCSVDQMCCIRILAVCMTAQMMLITPLMPLGCLLDYIRKHKKAIGSKVLLNWCTQIARGMTYLEERAIVHRDLAARNVLLQTPNHVRITDFGLAKLLDYNEEEYIAAGGKMPIKWLALECIQHRIFTHKSDVWSYGVTVWELFTYGQRPYESVRAAHVPDLLEKGERLPQPSMCTIDVYMIMIKCWMLDAESRPSFTELADEFGKMSRDPGRYLVIEGDKLMRLPSLTYDKNDLFRSLALGAEGPEELVEAEEYLMPQSSQAIEDDSADNNNEDPKVVLGSCSEDIFQPECGSEKETELDGRRREKRYGHLESAAAARQQRQMAPCRGQEDSINSRYSTDPIKYSKERDDITDLDPNHLMVNERKLSSLSSLQSSRHLPVDEDDYLQPKSSNPAAYMDIIGGKDTYNDHSYDPSNDELIKDILGPSTLASVENPEYFEQNETNTSASGTVGIFPWKDDNGATYYNDISKFDKARRELQPLILDDLNSETTV